jgi:hypothetical protein
MYSLKVGSKCNLNLIPNTIAQCMTTNVSASISSNLRDISMVKSKAFMRYMNTWDHFQFTLTLQAGMLAPLLRTQRIPMNDRFYFKNFKGISNIGFDGQAFDQSTR